MGDVFVTNKRLHVAMEKPVDEQLHAETGASLRNPVHLLRRHACSRDVQMRPRQVINHELLQEGSRYMRRLPFSYPCRLRRRDQVPCSAGRRRDSS